MLAVRNSFNRLLVLVLSFVSFCVGIIVLLLLANWIRPGDVSLGSTMFNQWSYFSLMRTSNPLVDILVGGICAFAGLVIFLWQILPRKREPADLLVRHDAQGQVTMARSSVRDLVQYEVGAMPEVIEASQDVKVRQDGLHVQVRSSLAPGADVNQVGKVLQERLRTSLQQCIGIPVAEVAVATQFAPLNPSTRRRVR